MNLRISQGQAIRSVLGCSRVTHFIGFLLGFSVVVRSVCLHHPSFS
jgi:hypothetical protein